ncbi:MAG: pirin family protein [Flavobacteriales bacterium]|jgi:redox-sensitive bicupin YhaK (pirin superfamily)
MKKVVHTAESRGHANHGWLNAKHSFSFAQWYDPSRIHFGALRVLNDDIVAPSMGFGKHPHDNMEIITIPLSGALRHQDSMGFTEVVSAGEVQVMSAGTGIFHSEMNASHHEEINLFQIWIFPNQQGVTPRYEQKSYNILDTENHFLPLVTPSPSEQSVWIHQNAWIHMATLSEDSTLTYEVKSPGNGVYLMNIDGVFEVAEEQINRRDAIGIWETNEIQIHSKQKARLLVIEVPMEF